MRGVKKKNKVRKEAESSPSFLYLLRQTVIYILVFDDIKSKKK
jgi:hypothetical protein